jgi:Zn-dependent protease with chaperone function
MGHHGSQLVGQDDVAIHSALEIGKRPGSRLDDRGLDRDCHHRLVERVPVMIVIRSVVAVALLAGFYVAGLGTVAVLAMVSVWLWWTAPGQLAHDATYAAVAVALGLVVPVWRLMRARPTPPPGTAVTEEQAPQLWSVVRELAVVVGTRIPDEIRLVPEPNAAVWEDAGLVGLRSGRRYLYLGVPILESCSISQVRAVLAHELGHYSLGHTRFGAATYRGMRSIADTLSRIRPRTLTGAVLTAYAAVYAVVALAVLRSMEIEADRAAVRAAGREAAAAALRGMPKLGSAWEAYLDSYVGWAQRMQYTPAQVLAYFGVLAERRAPELQRVPPRVAAVKPSRWLDSHPPIEERLTLIDREPGDPAEADPRPARVLVDDLDTRSAGLCTTSFDEHVAAITQENARSLAEPLYSAAAWAAGIRYGGLGTVLDLLAAGRAGDLRTALNRTVTGAGQLTDRVLAAVNATLVISAGAFWQHSWSMPMTLVSAGGDLIEAGPLVDQACTDPEAVPKLRELLHELGVPEAVTTDRVGRWHDRLDLGAQSEIAPGTRPGPNDLLLPDELFILAQFEHIPSDVLAAGLAAAALAELRLRGRVEVADSPEATLHPSDASPTGDRFLDSILDRVVQTGPRPAYQWLQLLGPDVEDAVRRRVGRWDTRGINIAQTARARILEALRAGDLERRDIILGALLWGTELTGSVLGWQSIWSRFWLGRVASRDRLAVAIRTIIGIPIRLPYSSGR